ncbi:MULTISPECIES: CBS domain-containing protein [Pseudonocardia]|uniref:Hypoxic response protein 1 n=2 Tax=Pseudonocardia TaxID=1847 RepID=A0A1Y2MMQ2_PSEAH|nr:MULTISPECIES: CBS domain-containing protein [Pseudonocardia]OSY36462.1 Hypoxic response protein 1 [Pseudonocardia autotrophica]TDN74754.1 CBS domain protein [Pseudonocardia autotrophica]BBG05529.1 signal transduction protein [Pseudonocardia autotrophica]GEC28054.1 signal transduction protein [Pseudonocardia saturnea]
MRIGDILKGKGSAVTTVAPDSPVTEVVRFIAEVNLGALPVVDAGRLVGIVSERDIVRRLHQQGNESLDARVSEVMTADVVTCSPDDGVGELGRIMTDRRIRHLPVVVDGELIGIVSIGDLVKARIDMLEQEREQLESYIAQ